MAIASQLREGWSARVGPAASGRSGMRPRRRRWPAAAACFGAVALLVMVGLPVYIGLALTHPARVPLHETPAAVGLTYEDVAFPSRVDHVTIRGWWLPAGNAPTGTVILAHGFAENRLIGATGLPLALDLHAQGWNVLMFDFRASGESGGTQVSVGLKETRDLLGGYDYVRQRAGAQGPIAFAGFSMGASTALLAAEEEPGVAGVLADSPFASLADYLHHDMQKWTHLPPLFNGLILGGVSLVTGLDPRQMDPVDHMRALAGRPVLLIAGSADDLIPPQDNAERLVTAAPPDTVTYWLAPGAGHTGAWQTDHAEFVRRLSTWLQACAAAAPVR